MTITIALFTDQTELQDLVNEKSRICRLPVVTDDQQVTYILDYSSHDQAPGYICQLKKTGKPSPGPVYVDFVNGKAAHRRLYGGGRNQPLARAIGIKPGINPTVIDTTSGLGRDSFVLACLGCQVTLLERNPVIAELLLNGLERASFDPVISEIVSNNMKLVNNDAIDYLNDLPQTVDTIYLDPMYPGRDKSALVKKEMRYFHDIAGKDSDAVNLLEKAIECHPKRVVVKRPKTAGSLGDQKPAATVESKNTRYDIYF